MKNGDDSLDICRVLNGMWQTSGGWGRIDRDDAVEAMLRYADAGLSTFDMADHCTQSVRSLSESPPLPSSAPPPDHSLSLSFLSPVFFADGPAEDLYGIFINRVRRERPPELLAEVRG